MFIVWSGLVWSGLVFEADHAALALKASFIREEPMPASLLNGQTVTTIFPIC